MTDYNERLDRILSKLARDTTLAYKAAEIATTPSATIDASKMYEWSLGEAKQALTSFIKELVAEAKPYRENIIDKWNKDRADEVKATNAAMNAWADIYEQNLLKALEEMI